MANICVVLVALLFGICSGAHPPFPDQEEIAGDSGNGEQCMHEMSSDGEEVTGHALLAARVVRNKIIDNSILPVEALESDSAKQCLAAVETLRDAVTKQGSATSEQLQQLFGIVKETLSEKANKSGSNILLQSNVTQPEEDPLAVRDRIDQDYIMNNDDPFFFPKQKKKREEFKGSRDVNGRPAVVNETGDVYEAEGEVVEKKIAMAIYIVGPLAFVFTSMFTLSNVMEKYEITAIPESGLMIAAGIMLGCFLKMYAHFNFFEDAEAFGEMNSAILNLVLLPIIIFASGWALRRQDFYSQFPYILLFAGLGVALSTLVIACLIYWTGYMEWHSVTRWRTAFTYASLISATDPVATLSTYAKLKVDPLLNVLVFGESIINDAVVIVVFNVLNADNYMTDSKGEMLSGGGLVFNIAWGIIKIFGGSTILGTALGMLYTFVAHWADMRHNKKGQILSIFASCYLTYAVAEGVGMSGIIAEMFAAIIMGIYMRPHLSGEGSLLATFFVKQLAALADAAVCLLIGVSVVQLTTKGLYFGLWVMIFCLIGRSAAVFPVGLFVNLLKETVGRANGQPPEGWNLLSSQHMFMMWHAGLRGAIALALALELGKWVDEIDGKGTRRALQTATFFLICTFLIVFGGSTSFTLKRLGIATGQDLPADHLAKTEDHGSLRIFMKWLDRVIFAPLLIGSTRNHAEDKEEQDVEDLLKDVHRW